MSSGELALMSSPQCLLGAVHRDVKSSNGMLTRTVRVSRFRTDAWRVCVNPTAEAHIVGSLPYMAPEQLAGTFCNARTDVWSFGIVLYESLTGRRSWLSVVGDRSHGGDQQRSERLVAARLAGRRCPE